MSVRQEVFHCGTVVTDAAVLTDVRVAVRDGVVDAVTPLAAPQPGDIRLGTVVRGWANAHSHAFHRLVRGRTHADGGDFWRWRDRMYEAAGSLTPESYRRLAETVFVEMRDAGYTTVGEFHYVHHAPDQTPYPDHAMELALVEAARSAGIRLVLLDTCYLRGGIGMPLTDAQRRFGDPDAHRWLERWHALRDRVTAVGGDLVTLGAAIHSVRAASRDDLAVLAAGLPADVPLHAHVSEQTAENAACLEAYGLTPVGVLAEHGLVSSRFSAVHATHLTPEDIRILGDAAATVVMCPTTEADLGDGIGPAPELQEAGARLAIGSDQHAVIDPWEELSRLELDQRLRLQRRGVFSLSALWAAGSVNGYRSLGLTGDHRGGSGFQVGELFDAVEVDTDSARTSGPDVRQLPLVARAADVTATIVGGRLTRPGARSR